MIKYIFIILMFLSGYANADVLQLDEVRVDYMSFFPNGRDPLITNNGLENRELGKLLDVSINTTVLSYGYWRSLVHSYTDSYSNTHKDGQFRSVGLNLEVGIRLTSFIDIYYWHYSQHLLDTGPMPTGFPVQDAVGIHLYLFSNQRKNSIF